MADLIERQEAIDALGEAPKYKQRIVKTYAEGRNDQWFDDVTKLSLLPSAQPERQPPTEDDYAYCAECNSVEMCRWYPLYGCQFRSLPSAQPECKTGQLLYHHTEDIDEERTADVYFCSSCKEEVLKKIRFGFCGGELDIHYGFCPICGARLRGESDETG